MWAILIIVNTVRPADCGVDRLKYTKDTRSHNKDRDDLVTVSRQRRDVIDRGTEDYLTRYGYLPESFLQAGSLRTLQQLEDAVRNLQGFAGLRMTGKIDTETRELMGRPRCGVQDVSAGFRNKRSVRVKRYNLQGQRWSHNNITWSLRQEPQNSYLSR